MSRLSWAKLFPYQRRPDETLREKIERLRQEGAVVASQNQQQVIDFTEPRNHEEEH
jgi:hypothetical protein